jgi:hypothetical protein
MLYYELFTGTCTRNRCYAISFTGTCTRCYAISFTKGILNCIILQNRVGGKQHFSINRIGMTNGSKNWMCETCADKHVRTRTCLTIRRFTVLPIIYIYILYISLYISIFNITLFVGRNWLAKLKTSRRLRAMLPRPEQQGSCSWSEKLRRWTFETGHQNPNPRARLSMLV